MQLARAAVAVLCFSGAAATQLRSSGAPVKFWLRGGAPGPAPAGSPAGGPGGSEEAPDVPVTTITMVLENVDYYNLTKTESGQVFVSKETTFHQLEDVMCDVVKKEVNKPMAPAAAPGPAGSPAGPASPAPALLQFARGPAPAPAPGPAGSPGPAGPKKPFPKVFCTLLPVSKEDEAELEGKIKIMKKDGMKLVNKPEDLVKKLEDKNMVGTPTKFVAQIYADDAKQALKAIQDGLEKKIEKKMDKRLGMDVEIRGMKVKTKEVEQWAHDKCQPQFKKIVTQFSNAYTRFQVPKALFNACTDFMTKLSFSHDNVLNAADTRRCQQATLKFQKSWKYSKDLPKNLEDLCVDICEHKYGNHAPQCHVTKGDELEKK